MNLSEQETQWPMVISYRFSRWTGAAIFILFLIGMAEGAAEYASRSHVMEAQAPGTNLVPVFAGLGIATAAGVIGVQIWRSRQQPARRGSSPWAAPFSARALARLGRTLRSAGQGRTWHPLRALATAGLLVILAYWPFMMGAHLTSDLDPNATVNAWGGPSYAGAVLAHWLGGILAFYATSLLLHWVMLPAVTQPPRGE